ncbi:MAG: serine protein kinase RIO [Candidatus Bathyarchaeota archaeon]|nr:serine protein kinase RIO [Candidatus Bathyarchaeota archaeon]
MPETHKRKSGKKVDLDTTKQMERRLRIVERRDRMLRKHRSEERMVLEEVFDRSTLMTIYELMNKGEIGDIFGAVKAGKESRLYLGKTPNEEEIAIKIYLTTSAEFKRGMLPYIMGDPRFKKIKRDTRSLVYAWALKEFKNLSSAYGAGVRVPRPIAVKKNVLLMEFIGKDGMSAPLMKEAELGDPKQIFRRLLADLKKLFRKAKLVHGDLSEYNVMVWDGKPVIFDLSQTVPLKHPNAELLLKRDLKNLHRFFTKQGVSVPSADEMFRGIVGAGA